MAYLDTWMQAHPQWRKLPGSKPVGDFQKVRIKLIAGYADPTTANNTLESRLRENPDDVLALYGKGILLDRENRQEEALTYLQQAIERQPLDGDILRDLGKVRFNRGDYEQALKNLKGALAFNPTDLEGQFLMGRCQIKTGDFKGAVDSFQNLLKVSPGYHPARYHLGEAYSKLGNAGDAHYQLGLYYTRKGPLRNAWFHLERALALLSDQPEKQEDIKKILKKLPRPEKDAGKSRQRH
jgi:tetratricopeptide (TPR) repeat protein